MEEKLNKKVGVIQTVYKFLNMYLKNFKGTKQEIT